MLYGFHTDVSVKSAVKYHYHDNVHGAEAWPSNSSFFSTIELFRPRVLKPLNGAEGKLQT
jgi:hypothetical protein